MIVNAEDTFDCDLGVYNNLKTKINNLELSIKYDDKGPIYEDAIKAVKAYIDSNKNTILWNKLVNPSFAYIRSLGNKEVHFSFKTRKIKELAGYVKNPEFDLKFKVSGISFDKNAVGESDLDEEGKVSYEIDKKVKLRTNVFVDSLSFYNGTPIENTNGPTPQVGQPTTYTIAWRIYNTTNRINDIILKGKLPIGVEYTGVIDPKKYYVVYNKETREIKWFIKNIEPFIGYRTDPKTLYFQVQYTPVLSEVGQFKKLVTDQTISYKDEFIDESKEYLITKDITTKISDPDSNYNTGMIIK